MNIARLLLTVFYLFGMSFLVQAESDYVLGPGDQIQIKVYGHEDLTTSSMLGSDGKITFQFVGELQAAGVTVAMIAEKIRSGLADDYIINPLVSINIVRYRNFYIQGEVEKPGGYPFEPGINVSKALALAGGLTDRGSEKKIELITQHKNNQKLTRKVTLNNEVKAGDIIVVGQRFF